ncbi:glutamate receptor 3.4-like [Hibiscus syriacus]|uniref:glutamate receptor 3.4-like n=1 Tax=Hibiscus syriacus TaxID=106335 RepID=UPI001921710B|nr:glutamate receptor 3.4-like [Hibiscus syriacus]
MDEVLLIPRFIRRIFMLFSLWFLCIPVGVICSTVNVSASSNSSSSSLKPKVINIGALFTLNSVIGRAAQPAIEAAIDDVNSNPNILNGVQLKLIVRDTNCSGFVGTMEALQLMESDVLVAIGSQSSGIAHVISHVVKELHVPLLSFGATDPTLSSVQYPYFIRTTHSDYFRMY